MWLVRPHVLTVYVFLHRGSHLMKQPFTERMMLHEEIKIIRRPRPTNRRTGWRPT